MSSLSRYIGYFPDKPADIPNAVTEKCSHHIFVMSFSDLFHVRVNNIVENAVNRVGARKSYSLAENVNKGDLRQKVIVPEPQLIACIKFFCIRRELLPASL